MFWGVVNVQALRQAARLHALYRSGEQLPFALLMMCIASYGLGGGKYSLDEKSKKKDG